ncbi:EKC/KEOPS complex subunit LAGE3, partial [Fukomys damarensis]
AQTRLPTPADPRADHTYCILLSGTAGVQLGCLGWSRDTREGGWEWWLGWSGAWAPLEGSGESGCPGKGGGGFKESWRLGRKWSRNLYVATSVLSVPFPTPLDAGIALGSLAPDAEPHSGVIGKELTASDSTLAVRWTAEDSHLLQVSVISFLDQLSLVVQTMQRFGPPVSR